MIGGSWKKSWRETVTICSLAGVSWTGQWIMRCAPSSFLFFFYLGACKGPCGSVCNTAGNQGQPLRSAWWSVLTAALANVLKVFAAQNETTYSVTGGITKGEWLGYSQQANLSETSTYLCHISFLIRWKREEKLILMQYFKKLEDQEISGSSLSSSFISQLYWILSRFMWLTYHYKPSPTYSYVPCHVAFSKKQKRENRLSGCLKVSQEERPKKAYNLSMHVQFAFHG